MNDPRTIGLKERQLKIVGTRPLRPDGVDKVTGRAKFGADLHVANMLIGKVLRSPHAHARIKSIDVSKAQALLGVKAVPRGSGSASATWRPSLLPASPPQGRIPRRRSPGGHIYPCPALIRLYAGAAPRLLVVTHAGPNRSPPLGHHMAPEQAAQLAPALHRMVKDQSICPGEKERTTRLLLLALSGLVGRRKALPVDHLIQRSRADPPLLTDLEGWKPPGPAPCVDSGRSGSEQGCYILYREYLFHPESSPPGCDFGQPAWGGAVSNTAHAAVPGSTCEAQSRD